MDPNAVTTAPQEPPPVQQRVSEKAQPQPAVFQYPPPQGNYVPLQQTQVRLADILPFSRPWHITKIVLGTASLICCIVIYGIGIYFCSEYSYSDRSYEFAFAGSAAGLALIWQTAEFITVCASSRHRGIHPGANVALHLLIWLVTVVAIVFSVFFLIWDDDDFYGYSSFYDGNNYSTASSARTKYRALQETSLSFLSILLIIHFTLFVRACVETHQYNAISSTVYLPITMAPPSYGYYPMVPQFQAQPPGMAVPPPQAQQLQPVVAPQNTHLYGHFAPTYNQQRASTVTPQSFAPGQQPPQSVSPVSNSDHQ